MAKASGGKLSEFTASGNPCVFETDVARPLKRLALSLLPRQSGSGDPSPENIRPLLPWGEVGTWTGGKNLFQTTAQSKTAQGVTFTVNNDGTVSVGGSATGYVDLILGEVPVPNTGKIRISGVGTARNIAWSTMRLIDENGDTVVDFYGTAYTYDFTINLDDYPTAKKIRLGIKRSNNGEVSGTVMPMVEIGDTTTAFVPFAPITPHPVNLGKNLFDINVFDRNGVVATKENGKAVIHGTAVGSAYNPTFNGGTLQAGTYTVSVSGLQTGMDCVIVKNGAWFKQITSSTTFTLTEEATISGYIVTHDGTEVNTTVAIQLEQGEQATDFQPYLPPVYGCELDLTTGEVWGTHGYLKLNTADMNNSENYPGWRQSGVAQFVGTGVNKLYYGQTMNIGKTFGANTNTNDILLLPVDTYEKTQTDWQALAVDVEIAVPLPSPVLLATLTPQQISSIVGVNTVWSDADDIELTYLKKG